MFEAIPLRWFDPVRRALPALEHGTLPRKALTAVLKMAARRRLSDLEFISPSDQPELRFANCDSMLIPYIYWFGKNGYEGFLVDWWRQFCSTSKRIVEIGANIGFYTVEGAQVMPAGATYTAVDPMPQVAAILRRNLALNHLSCVEVLEAAVVAEEDLESIELIIPAERWALTTGAFVSAGTEGLDRRERERVRVQARSARTLLGDADLIKIDAEGIEYTLLNSCRDILRKNRPTIIVEVLPAATRLQSFLRELSRDAGYHLYAIPGYTFRDLKPLRCDDLRIETLAAHNSRDLILTAKTLATLTPQSKR